MRVILCALVWISLIGTVLSADSTSARIAIISDADNKDLAALVMSELSGNPQISLLERDDLAKIGDELKVQQLAGNDAVALGKLVNADGLLFLNKTTSGIEVRLTAVGLGYALFDDQITVDQNPTETAKSIGHRVNDYVSKLKLDPAKTIPISVLNLRADYATADSATLERELTLLLESRLASQSNYVVLERRHAWSLGFEHSFATNDKPLLQGAYVIEGALSLATQGAGDVVIHLRLRSPKDQIIPLEIHGKTDDLHGLVEQMATEIQKATDSGASLQPWQSQQEARAYLLEGIWASHHGSCEETIEALDSAELLGETAPDLLAMRIPELCTEAVSGLVPVSYGITPRTTANPEPDERVQLVKRALNDQARYEQGHLESQLTLIDSRRSGLGRTGTLHDGISKAASVVLVNLLDTQNAQAGDVRSAIRAYDNYDPLNGKIPGDWDTSVNYANEWSISLAEELAYYRLIFETFPNPVWSNFLLDNVLSPDKFCARFLSTHEKREAALLQFLQDMSNDPAARPLALFYLAQKAGADQKDKACHVFYDEIWNDRVKLLATKRLGHFLRLAFKLENDRNVTVADSNLIAAVHYYLTEDTSFTNVTMNVWHPEFFPANEAPGLFVELQAYEKRAAAAGHADAYAGYMNKNYTDRFGNPEVKAVSGAPLVINRFWYPWLSTDWPPGSFTVYLTDADADGLWVSGFNTAEKPALFKINLTDFSTKIFPVPDKHFPQTLKCTPEATYITYHLHAASGQVSDPQIARLDFKTWTWAEHTLPNFFSCTLFNLDKTLYLFLNVQFASNEAAIARYDWDQDKFTVIASSRRVPSQSQFDNTQNYVIDGIFYGPGNKPSLTCHAGATPGTFYIQEGDGNWPPVFDDTWSEKSLTVNDKTLVFDQDGEVTLIDPAKAAPEHWMAPTQPHYRRQASKQTPAQKTMTPWLNETFWDAPGIELYPGIIGFHQDRLFIMEAPQTLGGDYELLCYQEGKGRSPQRVPLQFHLDDPSRAALSKNPGSMPRGGWKISEIEHPDTIQYIGAQLVTTEQGLCFKLPDAGFWFLPYGDIDAYLKANPK